MPVGDALVSAEGFARLRAILGSAIGELVDLETEQHERRVLEVYRAAECSVSTARAVLDDVAAASRGTSLEVDALALLGKLLRTG